MLPTHAAALAISLLAHGGLAWVLVAQPEPPPRSAASTTPVAFELVAPPPPPDPAPAARTPVPVPPTTNAEPPVHSAPRRRTVEPAPGPTPPAPEPVTPEPTQAPSPPTAPAPSPRPVPDPAVVAWLAPGGAPSAPATGPIADVDSAAVGAMVVGLAESANTPGHVSRRAPPRLRRTRDGGYRFDGHAFTARIAPDGRVEFEDTGATARREGLGVGGTFDITDRIMRNHGQDPYSSERAWFMAQTRELRDEMTLRARTADDDAALRGLGGRMLRVWRDASRPAHARRAALFRLWDDCADDEVGRRARAAVERFVRQRLPRGGPDGYTAAELTALNAGRSSPEAFRPY